MIISDAQSRNRFPKVSVIVPVYNMEDKLIRCIDSILDQSYRCFELILVDDGSSDRSPSICDQYKAKNDFISVIHKDNGGLSDARLAGFDAAMGEYILFVDSDDYIHPDMLLLMVESMEKNEADLSICGYYEKRESQEKTVFFPYDDKVLRGRVSIIEKYIKPLIGSVAGELHVPGFIWLRLMRKKIIQRSYFISERKYYLEDHAFDLLYADHVQTISFVHEPLYYYCVNRNSLTNRYRNNKWAMYCNLYSFFCTYIRERNIGQCEERLARFLQSAFCSCVDNAVQSGSYGQYRAELKAISHSGAALDLFSALRCRNVPLTYSITCSLYRLHLYPLLYFMRKQRLQR